MSTTPASRDDYLAVQILWPSIHTNITQEFIDYAIERYNNDGQTIAATARELGFNHQSLRRYIALRPSPDRTPPKQLDAYMREIKYDPADPRSAVCQTLDVCSHQRCHLAGVCPAYSAYVLRRHNGQRPMDHANLAAASYDGPARFDHLKIPTKTPRRNRRQA